jgi:hypothetical protein
MPTRIIRLPQHIDSLAALLRGVKLPITVSWTQGAPRTSAQNRLAFRWYMDAATQLGDRTHSTARAECKVQFAAPILCRDNEAFRLSWSRLRHRFAHEEIVEFVEATELPMTSIMGLKQMVEYMGGIERHWRGLGVRLTDPSALKYESEFE